jgi:hypothetical protein
MVCMGIHLVLKPISKIYNSQIGQFEPHKMCQFGIIFMCMGIQLNFTSISRVCNLNILFELPLFVFICVYGY